MVFSRLQEFYAALTREAEASFAFFFLFNRASFSAAFSSPRDIDASSMSLSRFKEPLTFLDYFLTLGLCLSRVFRQVTQEKTKQRKQTKQRKMTKQKKQTKQKSRPNTQQMNKAAKPSSGRSVTGIHTTCDGECMTIQSLFVIASMTRDSVYVILSAGPVVDRSYCRRYRSPVWSPVCLSPKALVCVYSIRCISTKRRLYAR